MAVTRYTNRTVALIDCLGFKKLIDESVSDRELFERIYSMQKNLSTSGRVGNSDSVDFKSCHFSDSIIVSANDTIGGIWTVLLACRSFCHTVIGHGIFPRGSVSVGPLLHEGNVVFGPALVEVAEVEKSVAIYPRIVLSRSLLDDMDSKAEFWSRNYNELYVARDDDGLSYLNVFDHPTLEVNTFQLLQTDEGRRYVINYFKRLVAQVERLTREQRDEHICEKYVWFARKLNVYLVLLNKALGGEVVVPVRE